MIHWDVVIEGVAVITGILCVWLNVRQNIWTWPTAIISSAIFGVVFFDARLYTTMLLQGLFIVISIYGWKAWLTGGPEGGALRVTRIRWNTGVILIALFLIGTIGFIYILQSFTEPDHAILESITTTLSVIASWMAARKILESWLVWIATDLIYVGLYFVTGLHLTLLLYVLYLGLATSGFIEWRKSYLHSRDESD